MPHHHDELILRDCVARGLRCVVSDPGTLGDRRRAFFEALSGDGLALRVDGPLSGAQDVHRLVVAQLSFRHLHFVGTFLARPSRIDANVVWFDELGPLGLMDLRRHARVDASDPVTVHVRVIASEQTFEGRASNISASGLLMEASRAALPAPPAGADATVTLQTRTQRLELPGRIARSDGRAIGLLLEPATPESRAGLGRLVQQQFRAALARQGGLVG